MWKPDASALSPDLPLPTSQQLTLASIRPQTSSIVIPQEDGSGSNLHRSQKWVQRCLDREFQSPGSCTVTYMGSMGSKGQVPFRSMNPSPTREKYRQRNPRTRPRTLRDQSRGPSCLSLKIFLFISCSSEQVKYSWPGGTNPGKMNPGRRGKVLNARGTEDLILIHGQCRVPYILRSLAGSIDEKRGPKRLKLS